MDRRPHAAARTACILRLGLVVGRDQPVLRRIDLGFCGTADDAESIRGGAGIGADISAFVTADIGEGARNGVRAAGGLPVDRCHVELLRLSRRASRAKRRRLIAVAKLTEVARAISPARSWPSACIKKA